MGSELGRRLPAAPNGARPFANTPATHLDMILPASYAINCFEYHKTSDIRRTLVGNKIVDHSDVVGASPVGAAPTTSSFST